MSAKEAAKEVPAEESAPTRALMFVLEDVAIDAHGAMFATLQKLLKDREIDLTQQLFSAHFLSGRIESNVPRLLRAVGRERLSGDKLVAEINEAIPEALLAQDVESGLKKMVNQLRESGVVVGAASMLSDEQTEALAKKAGLEDLLDGVMSCGNAGPHMPTTETWWRLAKSLSVKPIRSVVISSTASSMRAALKTGARAVVVETPYSECQDFGGADAVVSSFKELQAVVTEWLKTAG